MLLNKMILKVWQNIDANKYTLSEIKEILNNYELLSLKEVGCNIEIEEDADTFEGNSLKKAKEIVKTIS